MSNLFHNLIRLNSLKKYQYFRKNFKNQKEIQLKKLNTSYEEFINKFPVTTYQEWEQYCLLQQSEKIHCVPTSGSTSKIKWIPYNEKFKVELSYATNPWIYDLYKKYPKIRNGKHFWSMSWLPHDLRKSHSTNDLDHFSLIEKFVMKQTMAINEDVSVLETLEESMLKSLQLLIDQEVTLISIWSPSFLIEMLNLIITQKEKLLRILRNSKKKNYIKYKNIIDIELTEILFPNLILISAWGTSTSEFYFEKLKLLFPKVEFQGKGLWATEAVVSIPFEGKNLLSYCSHFYEFECIETKKIYNSFNLEKEMKLKVIVTTGNGIKRYNLNDIVKVSNFLHGVPCLEFLGREKEVDLVGEKLNQKIFLDLIKLVKNEFNINIVFFIGVVGLTSHYKAIIEADPKLISEHLYNELSAKIEMRLLENFHYRIARESKQLMPIKLLITQNPIELYQSNIQDKILIKGNVKIEPIIIVRESYGL